MTTLAGPHIDQDCRRAPFPVPVHDIRSWADLQRLPRPQRPVETGRPRSLGWLLGAIAHLGGDDIDRLVAARMGIACVKLESFRPAPGRLPRLQGDAAQRAGIVALHENASAAWFACADVTDSRAVALARQYAGRRAVLVHATRREIDLLRRRIAAEGEAGAA